MHDDVELAWRAEKDPLKAEAELIHHYNPADNHLIPERDFSPEAYKEKHEQAGQPIPETDLPVFIDEIPF